MRLKIEHCYQRLVLTNQVFASTLTTTFGFRCRIISIIIKGYLCYKTISCLKVALDD